MLEILETCTLRPVDAADEDLILQMRNQDFVRSCMLNHDVIAQDVHHAWFQAMLRARDKAYFILLHHGQPAGVIGFFNISEGCANWSFYLACQTTPAGLGSSMCFLGLENIFKNNNVSHVKTYVLNDNTKSIALHLKLGFEIADVDETHHTTGLFLKKSTWDKHKHGLLKK